MLGEMMRASRGTRHGRAARRAMLKDRFERAEARSVRIGNRTLAPPSGGDRGGIVVVLVSMQHSVDADRVVRARAARRDDGSARLAPRATTRGSAPSRAPAVRAADRSPGR
jgi:hypothetical protein